jgi:hypothetical protein
MRLLVEGARDLLRGQAQVPNSKYHAHRALILASLAEGTSRIHGLSDARHVDYTVRLLRSLGTRIDVDGGTFVVHGGRYSPRRDVVSAGSSGTTLYFMIGLACLADSDVTVTGQKYFQRRPVGPLLDALGQMGVRLDSQDGCPPVRVEAHRPTGGEVHIADALAVDLGYAAARAVRHRPHHDPRRRGAQRAHLPGTHRVDDAAVRPAGRGLRGLAPLPRRARPAGDAHRVRAAPGHRLRRVRDRRGRPAPL